MSETLSTQRPIDRQAQRRARMTFLLIVASFVFPLLLATLWYGYVQNKPADLGNTAHNTLIVPAVPIENISATEYLQPEWNSPEAPTQAEWQESASDFGDRELRGRWSLVFIPAEGPCAEACQGVLYKQRQARIALNNRMTRVQRIVLRSTSDQLPPPLLAEHRDLRVIDASPGSGGAALRAAIEKAGADLPPGSNATYVLDPLGNVMMRISEDADGGDIRDDIKHLLQVSRIG